VWAVLSVARCPHLRCGPAGVPMNYGVNAPMHQCPFNPWQHRLGRPSRTRHIQTTHPRDSPTPGSKVAPPDLGWEYDRSELERNAGAGAGTPEAFPGAWSVPEACRAGMACLHRICMNESCRSPWRSQSSWSCIGDDPTGLIESSLTTIALTVSCSDPPGTVLSTASMADYLSVLGPLVATPSAAILPMDGPESFLVVTSSSNRLPRISMACLHCRNR
jgi:hypothetical protein